MRKILSFILVFTLITGVFPAFALAAAPENFPISEKTVMLNNDFSTLLEAEVLKGSNKEGGLSVVDNAAKGQFIGAVDPYDAGNMCISFQATASTGPRLAYSINPDAASKFTIEYRTMAIKVTDNSASSSSLVFYKDVSEKTGASYAVTANKWVYVKCDCNMVDSKIDVYTKDTAGGDYVYQKSLDLEFSEKIDIRFSASSNTTVRTYYDDIKVYSYDRVVNGKSAVFFSDDFEAYAENEDIQKSKARAWQGTNVLSFKAMDGTALGKKGKIGAMTNSSGSAADVSAEIYKGTYKHFTCAAVLCAASDGGAKMALYDGAGNGVASAALSDKGKWHYIRFDVDEESGYVRIMMDGNLISFDKADFESGEAYSLSMILPAGTSRTLYMDSINVFDDDQAISEDGDIDLEKFVYKPSGVVPIGSVLRNSHPRIMVTNFADLYGKIRRDGIARRYYEYNFAGAEAKFSKPPTEFEIYQRPGSYATTLTTARNLEGVIFTFAFVYNIEKERIKAGECTYDYVLSRGYSAEKYGSEANAINEFKNHVEGYKARALEEIYNAGTYPTWLPETTICMSESAEGVAVGYDWLYNYTTAEEHARILDILARYAGVPYVQMYKGIKYSGWQKTSNNRTIVNAASSMSVASAFYDIYPDAAEFIMQGAVDAMKYGALPYQYDGAFPEGPGYWGYSTDFFCIGQSTILSMIGDGEVVPQYAKFYENFPGMDTTCDYFVLFHGPLGGASFGDGGLAYGTDPAVYYLASLYNKPEYAAFNRALENRTGSSGLDSVCAIIWMKLDDVNIFDAEKLPLDKVYDNPTRSSIVFNGASFRSSFDMEDASWVALRGGANNASHGNPNGGEFIFEANGVRWTRVPNSHDYDDRFYFYDRRAEGRNTVIINPAQSGYTEASKAQCKILDHKETKGSAWAILDMTETNNALTDAKRGVLLTDHRKSLIVQDEFTAKEPSEFYWFMHTYSTYDDIVVSPDNKSAILTVGDEKLYVRLNDIDNAGLKLDKMAALPLAPEEEWYVGEAENVYTNPAGGVFTPKYGYKLFVHAENVTTFNMSVELVPFKKGEDAPEGSVLKYAPMSDWKTTDFDSFYPDKPTSYNMKDTSWYSPSSTVYSISSAAELSGLAYLVNEEHVSFEGKTIKLADNIDMSEITGSWIPIGTSTNPFKGMFDGDGRKIINFKQDSENSFFGIFGVINKATIKNLVVTDIDIDGGYGVGGVCAVASESDFENISVSGNVIGTYYIGGIVGCMQNTRITNCVTNVNFLAMPVTTFHTRGSGFVGGLAGFADESKITNCVTHGQMENFTKDSQIVGRIAGLSTFSEFENVFYPNMKTVPAPFNRYSTYTDSGLFQYNYSSGKVLDSRYANSSASELLSEYASKNGYDQWTSTTIPDILVPIPETKNLSRLLLSDGDVGSGTVSFKAENVSDTTAASYVIAASYKDGVMVSYAKKFVLIAPSATSNVSIPLDTKNCDSVIVFPWATLSGMYTNGNILSIKLK